MANKSEAVLHIIAAKESTLESYYRVLLVRGYNDLDY